MNLLCPNCQKPLTVAEQNAGQLMKCPLCNNTFTVPALAPAMAPGEPPSYTAGAAAPPTYSLASEPPLNPNAGPDLDEPLTDHAHGGPAHTTAEPPAPPAGYVHTRMLRLRPDV